MHAKLGSRVKVGEPLCTLFAAESTRFLEPEALLREALVIAEEPGRDEPLIQEIITAKNKKQYLEAAHRP